MKISEVQFGSLLTYTPRGNQTEHYKSRTVMRNLKNDESITVRKFNVSRYC